jgi:hypothetical protein
MLERSEISDWLSVSRPKIRASGKKYLLAKVQTSSEGPNSLLLKERRAIFPPGIKRPPLETDNSPHLLPRLIIKLRMNAILIFPLLCMLS